MASNQNLLTGRKQYNRYLGGFRGVDFSSDPTMVRDDRFAYATNVYKDYDSGKGEAVETICGFRKVVDSNSQTENRIYGIHEYKNGTGNQILVHKGENLYKWYNFPQNIGVKHRRRGLIYKDKVLENETYVYVYKVYFDFLDVSADIGSSYSVTLKTESGTDITTSILGTEENANLFLSKQITIQIVAGSSYANDNYIGFPVVCYAQSNGSLYEPLYTTMKGHRSESFMFNGDLYIIDGKHFLRYDGTTVTPVTQSAYIPTTVAQQYIEEGVFQNVEIEQRNLLTSHFKNSFLGDGTTKTFYLSEQNLTSVVSIKSVERYNSDPNYDTDIVYSFTPQDFTMYSYEDAGTYRYPFKSNGDGTYSFAIHYDDSENRYLCKKIGFNESTLVESLDAIGINYGGNDATSQFFLVNVTRTTENNTPVYSASCSLVMNHTYINIESDLFSEFNIDVTAADGSVTLPIDPVEGLRFEIEAVRPITRVSGVTSGDIASGESIINKCTLFAIYDDRVFLSGNPDYPNHIFWSAINDANFFGILQYVQDGADASGVVGMMSVGSALAVLKGEGSDGSAIYYHTATDNTSSEGGNILPTLFPSQHGLHANPSLGCINFKDDPVFMTERGLDAIGYLSVANERSIQHRSSNIDAIAPHQIEDMFVFNDYLMIRSGSRVFMADSRQKWTNELGYYEYEWYVLDDICDYSNLTDCYEVADIVVPLDGSGNPETVTATVDGVESTFEIGDPSGMVGMKYPKEDVNFDENNASVVGVVEIVHFDGNNAFVVGTDGKAYLVDLTEEKILKKNSAKIAPTCMTSITFNGTRTIAFGTANGDIFVFNFDKRDPNGEIPSKWYSFDGRTIISGVATKWDNCGIPNLTKTTEKHSVVVKMETMQQSTAKVKVRTDRTPYSEDRKYGINSSYLSFDDSNLMDFSFNSVGSSLFSVSEKEKKWVEKQYYIYTDEFCKPFTLHYISYRYVIAGRYRNQ